MNTQFNPDSVLYRVLAGPMSPEVSDELDAWLREDKQHPMLLAQFMSLEDTLITARKEASASSIFSLLLESEGAATPITLQDQGKHDVKASTDWLSSRPADPVEHDTISLRELCSICGYVLRRALTSRPAYNVYAAAAVLLGVVLAIVMLTGPNESERIAAVPDQVEPIEVLPSIKPTVATLTATHNAQWADQPAERALARGSALRAGQTLALTQGLAEITTNDGAVAILEAPATIELLDNDNAIRLHKGKLVGLCETESSKGFLVRTPHADVTDLGTEFGLEVLPDDDMRLHVFEGAVRVKPSPIGGSSVDALVVSAGQAVEIKPEQEILRLPVRPGVFARSLDRAELDATAYQRAVLDAGPVSYWRFGSGKMDALRCSVSDETLRLVGSARIHQHQHRSWLTIQADEAGPSYAELRDYAGLADAASYTFESWARPEAWRDAGLISCSVRSDDTSLAAVPTAMMLHLHSPKSGSFGQRSIRFAHRNPPAIKGPSEALDRTRYEANRWMHIVGVKHKGELRLYVDGALVSQTTDHTPMTGEPLHILLGFHIANESPVRQFAGDIDEIAFYKRALTEKEVAEHYAIGSAYLSGDKN